MKHLCLAGLLFVGIALAQGQEVTILKCSDPAGNVDYFRNDCPDGFTGEPSDEWVKQPWVQANKREAQKVMDDAFGKGEVTVDDAFLLEEADDFYPDWTEIGYKAAEQGLTLERVRQCLENQEYTTDPRPGIAAEGCITYLALAGN